MTRSPIQGLGSLGPGSLSGLYEFASSLRAGTLQRNEAPPAQSIVMREEALDFLDKAGTELIDVIEIRMGAGLDGDTEKPIVALDLTALLPLLSFDHPEEAHSEQASHFYRRIQQDEDVEGIAILSKSGGE
ncbi:hypothetical protein DHODJN_25825 [Methylorubrum extorquens]